jgi:hypothetical protein
MTRREGRRARDDEWRFGLWFSRGSCASTVLCYSTYCIICAFAHTKRVRTHGRADFWSSCRRRCAQSLPRLPSVATTQGTRPMSTAMLTLKPTATVRLFPRLRRRAMPSARVAPRARRVVRPSVRPSRFR